MNDRFGECRTDEERLRLAEINERLGKATLGPWEVGRHFAQVDASRPDQARCHVAETTRTELWEAGGGKQRENAILIAHTPDDLIWLQERLDERDGLITDMALDGLPVEELMRLRRENALMRAALEEIRSNCDPWEQPQGFGPADKVLKEIDE